MWTGHGSRGDSSPGLALPSLGKPLSWATRVTLGPLPHWHRWGPPQPPTADPMLCVVFPGWSAGAV